MNRIFQAAWMAIAIASASIATANETTGNGGPRGGQLIPINANESWLIERAEPDSNSDGMLYFVSVVTDQDRQPLCPGEDGEMLSAIPLQGSWDTFGVWSPEGTTLACHNGVLAKCVRWGYAPWSSQDGISLRDHHQACSRLARADYCGDGVPHTRDGTLINVWDALGIQLSETSDELVFEASWTPEGAFNIQRTRFPEGMAYVVENCPERLAGGGYSGEALLWNESVPR